MRRGYRRNYKRGLKNYNMPKTSISENYHFSFLIVVNFNIEAYLLKVFCRYPLRVRTDPSEIEGLLHKKYSPRSHWHDFPSLIICKSLGGFLTRFLRGQVVPQVTSFGDCADRLAKRHTVLMLW